MTQIFDDRVRSSDLLPGPSLPLLVEPAGGRFGLVSWAAENRQAIAAHLVAHGRNPFVGDRKVVVGMAEAYSSD